ncbi:MAG: hypothetical protein GY729_02525 [Desulfobacteraceae bacterium]|nr:hypothetical protein [Desulfobacteraceae bacterium]
MIQQLPPDKNIEDRIIRLKLIDGSQVNGLVNINRLKGYDRLSDFIASPNEPFLVLFNAALYYPDTGDPTKHRTLFINKQHIIWAEPDEDQK